MHAVALETPYGMSDVGTEWRELGFLLEACAAASNEQAHGLEQEVKRP